MRCGVELPSVSDVSIGESGVVETLASEMLADSL